MKQADVAAVQARVIAAKPKIVQFLRELCAIPSMESQIGPVGERAAAEMRALKFDEVRFDKMGNILGRIGSGPRTIVFDSHIDTVGVGAPTASGWRIVVFMAGKGRRVEIIRPAATRRALRRNF